MARVQCCAPFCRKAWNGSIGGVEQLCPAHYMRVDVSIRDQYEAAWADADKADQDDLANLDEDAALAIYARVTVAWEAVKADAAAKALAN